MKTLFVRKAKIIMIKRGENIIPGRKDVCYIDKRKTPTSETMTVRVTLLLPVFLMIGA